MCHRESFLHRHDTRRRAWNNLKDGQDLRTQQGSRQGHIIWPELAICFKSLDNGTARALKGVDRDEGLDGGRLVPPVR